MEFEYSARCATLREKLLAFMDEHIYPNEHAYKQEVDNNGKEKGNRWLPTHIIEEFVPAQVGARARRPVQSRLCAAMRNHGPHSLGTGSLQLLRA